MTLTGSIVVFVVTWWLILFMVLPFGVRSQWEDGEVVDGTPDGAPVAHNLPRKLLITTGISIAVFALIWLAVEFNVLGIDRAATWGIN